MNLFLGGIFNEDVEIIRMLEFLFLVLFLNYYFSNYYLCL